MKFEKKEGFKQTKIGWLPNDWAIKIAEQVTSILLSNVDKKIIKGEIFVFLCNYMDVYNNDYIGNATIFMSATARRSEIEKFGLKKFDVIMTKDSETPEDIAIPAVVVEELDNVACGYHLAILRPIQELIYGPYLMNAIKSKSVHGYFVTRANGSTRFNLTSETIRKALLPIPPLPEQKKIAEILTSVDNTIESTRKVIEQTKRVKQGLLQELLTKGIGHTKFKKTVIGEIPEEWEVMDYGSLVEVEMPPIEMKDDDYYAPTIVRRRNNGIETRETKKGKHILVKNQYKTVPGTFLISRRQIIHRACGIVPEGLSNAIISKEYLALKAKKKKLDIRYLYFHSLTHIFQLTIIRTTYGVDDEKFVFKDKWWMKEKMPLPPLKEQKKIIDIFLSIDKKIIKTEKELNQLQQLKKGLMQDLLSGTVRVKV
jgi:type I restriction enzyme S subunit